MGTDQQPTSRPPGPGEGVCVIVWMGESSPLLEVAWSRATVFHVHDERALLDVLRAQLASCVVLDTTTFTGDVGGLVTEVRRLAPGAVLLALVDAPPHAPITTAMCRQFDLCISRHAAPSELIAGLHLLTLRSTRRMAEVSASTALGEQSSDQTLAALQERLRHLEGLVQTTFTISRAAEEHDILHEMRQVAQVAIDVDDMVVLLADDKLVDLSDTLLGNTPPEYLAVCREQLYALPFDLRVTYLGDEVLMRETPDTADTDSIRVREARALGAQSYMRLPLLIDQQVIGFVAFYSKQPGRFTGSHLQLGRLFVAQVAATVRNIRLFVRARQAEERQQAVGQVARLIADRLELQPVLENIVREALRLVNGGAATLLLREPDGCLVVRAVDGAAPLKVGERVPPGLGQAGRVAQTGEPSIVANYDEWEHANPVLRGSMPPNHVLYGVPLSYHGEVLGVLQVVAQARPTAEMDMALDVLLALAPQAAMAIAKAQLHEQVAQDRRQLRAVLEHTSAAVVVFDAEGRVLLLNPAAERVLQRLGLRPEDVTTQPVTALLTPNLLAELPPLSALAGPLEIVLGDAGVFVVHIAKVTNDAGEVERYIAVAQDVSDIRRVDRMRSDMVGVLTHDLGNLLMMARNPIEMLEDPNLQPEQRNALRNMLVSSLVRMEQLVKDVIALDRAEQSGADAAQPYLLPQVVSTVVASNQDDARAKSIALRYHEVGVPPHPLRGIEMLIKQAIDNLVSNAIKYTPNGGHVDVVLDVEGEYAVIRVADDGFGIPADKVRFIFDPFYRVKGDERLNGIHGTGLGLSLVKTIAERHGGSIEVQSEMRVGSVFTLRLPLEDRMQSTPPDALIRLDLSRLAERAKSTARV